MTNIKIDMKRLKLSMRGHSGDETLPESSSVCTAESTLVETLALYLKKLPGLTTYTKCSGMADLTYCRHLFLDYGIAKIGFEVAMEGFKGLEESYPEYLKVNIID